MKDQAEKLREIALKTKLKIEKEILKDIKQTKIIVVSSGKGGVGKSTLALGLAIDLSRKNKRVVLFDADLGMANIDIMLGVLPKYNLYHVTTGNKSIQDIIITTDDGLDIIPGGSGIYELANLNEDRLKNLLVQMGKLDGVYDYMIIDTGAGISKSVITFLLAGDDVIVITTPEPTAITDAYGIVKSLNKGSFAGNVYLVVNRVIDGHEGIMIAEKFKLVCNRYLGIDIKFLGYIVNEPLITEGIKRQQPFMQLFPKSMAAKNVNMIGDSLLKEGIETEADIINLPSPGRGIKNFFRKLAGIS